METNLQKSITTNLLSILPFFKSSDQIVNLTFDTPMENDCMRANRGYAVLVQHKECDDAFIRFMYPYRFMDTDDNQFVYGWQDGTLLIENDYRPGNPAWLDKTVVAFAEFDDYIALKEQTRSAFKDSRYMISFPFNKALSNSCHEANAECLVIIPVDANETISFCYMKPYYYVTPQNDYRYGWSQYEGDQCTDVVDNYWQPVNNDVNPVVGYQLRNSTLFSGTI